MPNTVAALYIDPRGPYPRMQAANAYDTYDEDKPVGWISPREDGLTIDCWDASRDARKYDGPHPVVAHPPCGPWGRLRHLYRGNEHDCALYAVTQVRRWGGVLEHPAGSRLWLEHFPPKIRQGQEHLPPAVRLRNDGPTPVEIDSYGGYTIEVDQCEWGHVARKRTWLYLVGVPREALEAPPFPGREPTKSVSGRRGRATQAEHPNWKEQLPRCSDAERRRTPPLFAEYMIRLARAVRR